MLFHSLERWLKAEFISLQVLDQVSYNDAPRFLPILRSRYRENHVAYRSDNSVANGEALGLYGIRDFRLKMVDV